MLSLQGQRENVKLEANEREGVGVCSACGAGFYTIIKRTRDPVLDRDELKRRKNKSS